MGTKFWVVDGVLSCAFSELSATEKFSPGAGDPRTNRDRVWSLATVVPGLFSCVVEAAETSKYPEALDRSFALGVPVFGEDTAFVDGEFVLQAVRR